MLERQTTAPEYAAAGEKKGYLAFKFSFSLTANDSVTVSDGLESRRV